MNLARPERWGWGRAAIRMGAAVWSSIRYPVGCDGPLGALEGEWR